MDEVRKLLMVLPLTPGVRFRKVLAAVRNHDKYPPRRLEILLHLYLAHREMSLEELLEERLRLGKDEKQIFKETMEKYRSKLLKEMLQKQSTKEHLDGHLGTVGKNDGEDEDDFMLAIDEKAS